MYVFGLLASSLILNCLCYELSKSNDRVLVEGGDLELECSLQAASGESFTKSQLTMKWVKTDDEGNKENIAQNDLLEIDNERYQVSLDFGGATSDYYIKTANYKLTITGVEVVDDGKYNCEVSLSNSKNYENSEEINIDVLSYQIELNVLTGDDTYLECLDESYNVSEVSFSPNRGIFKEGTYFEDNRVKLNDVTLNMGMKYYCNATLNNANEDNIFRAIYLYILKPLEVYTRNTLIKRSVNDNVVLTCFIYSFTPVSVKWINKYGQIENSDKFSMSLVENENYLGDDDSANYHIFNEKFLKMSKLEINNITMYDKGPYLCSVSNSYDEENQRFVVKVRNEIITSLGKFPEGLTNINVDDLNLEELSDAPPNLLTSKKPFSGWIDKDWIEV